MEYELKREKIVRLAKEDPFLTVDKIASLAETTIRYVRTVLYENNISLQELRRIYAQKWKNQDRIDQTISLEQMLYNVAIEYINNKDLFHFSGDSHHQSNGIELGLFTSITSDAYKDFRTILKLCKEELLNKEWVELVNSHYLVHFRVYNTVKLGLVLYYQAGDADKTYIVKSDLGISLEPKELLKNIQFK